MPAIGNFRRIVGSAADMSELEYISALHQTILPNLREDGTISAKDIAVYLKSRYGLVLTSAEAIDIACGLCGAKQRTTKFNQQVSDDERREGDENMGKEDNEEDDDAYCFDLVHVAALLLIPEMVEYAEAYKAGGTGQDSIFEVVYESLIEPLDEVVEDEIRAGVPLSLELLRKILICGGDMDTAKDENLMKQMLVRTSLLDSTRLDHACDIKCVLLCICSFYTSIIFELVLHYYCCRYFIDTYIHACTLSCYTCFFCDDL